ncbi:hypothetical protein ACFRAU_07400 [Arthrobacter sp. NPDC056691]|uniref:hypothetical protein n=1 Tax=Arthrobacter sp. NPDC056691 TaxID=3345913 RepID=UPI003671F6C0
MTQSNTLTQSQIEEVEGTVGSVCAPLNPAVIGDSEEVAAEAQGVADEIQSEIESAAPNSGKVKALPLKLVELAATGTVQSGIDALNTLTQQGIAGM